MRYVVIEKDQGLASQCSICVDYSRGQGELRGCQGDDRSGDAPEEEAFVDLLVSPQQRHPGENRREITEVEGEAGAYFPEPSACEVGMDQ